MKVNKFLRRSLCLCLISTFFVLATGSVEAGSLSDAQEEKRKLEEQLDDAEQLIDELKDSKSNIEERISQLDSELTGISSRITDLEGKLLEKEDTIASTQQELCVAQDDMENQYNNMKMRIRFMYENGTGSYLELLLSSESIADFMNYTEYIYQMTLYDRDMLKRYQDTVAMMVALEEKLEQEKTELVGLKQQVEEEQESVELLLAEKERQLEKVGDDISEAQSIAGVYEAEIQAQNEIIAQIQAEEARQKENGGQPQHFGGVFVWPCPSSTRITSDYGPRTAPAGGASSYHKGIDVGASYGANIVSAADGTVSFAGYNNAAGNYVTINHGDGIYTVYMHCSSLNVSAGQKVLAGQVIAKVGSTGISTGNHLHFGVSVNGSYVNPWDYLK